MQIPTMPQTIDWEQLFAWFPMLMDLDGCPQDVIFHAEGDVLVHTKMVLEALMTHSNWQQLDADWQQILWWSALLHDIAKPLTTIEEYNRIRSPRHALKGAQIVQNLLYQDFPSELVPLPLAYRQQIVSLVRYHGLPLWFWDKDDMLYSVMRASQHVPPQYIALLAEADVIGRICNDQQDLLDRITLFREFCIENSCYDSAYQFPSDYSRFLYFQNSSNHPTYQAYDDTICTVTLMSGLPASGKDTWLVENKANTPIISLDKIREQLNVKPTDNQSQVVITAKEQARQYLRQQQDFVWNATNLTRRMRSQLIDLFTDYKARVEVIYLEVPFKTIIERNQDRKDSVPIDVLRKMAQILDVPSITEAHSVQWITH